MYQKMILNITRSEIYTAKTKLLESKKYKLRFTILLRK